MDEEPIVAGLDFGDGILLALGPRTEDRLSAADAEDAFMWVRPV